MDWTLEDSMVDGLFFCATLTGRRGGHAPFVQASVETSDIDAEAVKLDPRSSWESHSGVLAPVSGWFTNLNSDLNTNKIYWKCICA